MNLLLLAESNDAFYRLALVENVTQLKQQNNRNRDQFFVYFCCVYCGRRADLFYY